MKISCCSYSPEVFWRNVKVGVLTLFGIETSFGEEKTLWSVGNINYQELLTFRKYKMGRSRQDKVQQIRKIFYFTRKEYDWTWLILSVDKLEIKRWSRLWTNLHILRRPWHVSCYKLSAFYKNYNQVELAVTGNGFGWLNISSPTNRFITKTRQQKDVAIPCVLLKHADELHLQSCKVLQFFIEMFQYCKCHFDLLEGKVFQEISRTSAYIKH